MNRKIYLMALAALLMAGSAAEAQSIDKKLEQLAKDPKTAENAARADVYIIGHQISRDSAQHQNKEQATKAKKKNRKCKKHTS